MHTQTTHTRTYTNLSQLFQLFGPRPELAGAMVVSGSTMFTTSNYTSVGQHDNPPKIYYIRTKNGMKYETIPHL